MTSAGVAPAAADPLNAHVALQLDEIATLLCSDVEVLRRARRRDDDEDHAYGAPSAGRVVLSQQANTTVKGLTGMRDRRDQHFH